MSEGKEEGKRGEGGGRRRRGEGGGRRRRGEGGGRRRRGGGRGEEKERKGGKRRKGEEKRAGAVDISISGVWFCGWKKMTSFPVSVLLFFHHNSAAVYT